MARKTDQDGLYKRGDSSYWWATYTDANGRRVISSTGTEEQREAVALLAKWKLEVYRQRNWEEQPPRTFEELMVEHLRHSQGVKRPRGHARDLLATQHLRESFGGRCLDDIAAPAIRDYIAARRASGMTPATINRELCVLSAALNYVRRELEWNVNNPVAGRKLREPEGRVRWLTYEEAQRLIEAAGREPQAQHLPDFIRLALHTGCRKGELLDLEWSRVDLKQRVLHLGAENTKTGKRRGVPLNAIATQALESRARFRALHCPSSRWVFAHATGERIGDIKHAFTTACRRARIQNFRIHDLRHTCAAWLVSAGVPLTEVRDLLGHNTVRMTERYAHLAPENVRAAVALLEPGASRFSHGSN